MKQSGWTLIVYVALEIFSCFESGLILVLEDSYIILLRDLIH